MTYHNDDDFWNELDANGYDEDYDDDDDIDDDDDYESFQEKLDAAIDAVEDIEREYDENDPSYVEEFLAAEAIAKEKFAPSWIATVEYLNAQPDDREHDDCEKLAYSPPYATRELAEKWCYDMNAADFTPTETVCITKILSRKELIWTS